MRLPRDIGAEDLISLLRRFGYVACVCPNCGARLPIRSAIRYCCAGKPVTEPDSALSCCLGGGKSSEVHLLHLISGSGICLQGGVPREGSDIRQLVLLILADIDG